MEPTVKRWKLKKLAVCRRAGKRRELASKVDMGPDY